VTVWRRLTSNARAKSRSLRRLAHRSRGPLTGSVRCRSQSSRSALRATVRARWSSAPPPRPHGRTKERTGSTDAVSSSISVSRRFTWRSSMCRAGVVFGVASSARARKISCWSRVSCVSSVLYSSRSGRVARATPSSAPSSSNAPKVRMRAELLATLEPPTRPVVPSSPVRV